MLHDVHFLVQMAHFNREKVIERQPHAKGSGAFGTFETAEDVSAYTKAALFQKGAVTDMLALLGGVREPVLSRAFQYWKSIDADVGRRIEEKVHADAAPKPAEGMGER